MEKVEGVELYNYLIANSRMTENQASIIIKQLLRGVNYLNSLNIVHRDLKLENIIIDPKTYQVKIVDFGLSTFYSPFRKLKTIVGTAYYIAPETLRG